MSVTPLVTRYIDDVTANTQLGLPHGRSRQYERDPAQAAALRDLGTRMSQNVPAKKFSRCFLQELLR